MKTIRAIVSFAGAVSMGPGEVRDVADDLAEDLIRAGHAEEAQPNEVKRAGSGSGKAARQKRT